MILHSDATTPFGRKCMVAALERGIALEERFVDLANPGDYLAVNPLNQIPALTTENGAHLFDSDVILQYLDTRHDGPPLIPDDDRFSAMTQIHLANGVIEATLLRIMEIRRKDGERSPGFISHLEARVGRGLAAMEAAAPSADGPLSAFGISAAAALEYVDFRYEHPWRKAAPKLADFLTAVAERPSMAATRPTRTAPVRP